MARIRGTELNEEATKMPPLTPAEQVTAERRRILREEGEEQLRAVDAIRNRVWT